MSTWWRLPAPAVEPGLRLEQRGQGSHSHSEQGRSARTLDGLPLHKSPSSAHCRLVFTALHPESAKRKSPSNCCLNSDEFVVFCVLTRGSSLCAQQPLQSSVWIIQRTLLFCFVFRGLNTSSLVPHTLRLKVWTPVKANFSAYFR